MAVLVLVWVVVLRVTSGVVVEQRQEMVATSGVE